MRCLSNQSLFKMPPPTESSWEESPEDDDGEEAIRDEMLEKSGKANVLIGGCSEWRCVEITV